VAFRRRKTWRRARRAGLVPDRPCPHFRRPEQAHLAVVFLEDSENQPIAAVGREPAIVLRESIVGGRGKLQIVPAAISLKCLLPLDWRTFPTDSPFKPTRRYDSPLKKWNVRMSELKVQNTPPQILEGPEYAWGKAYRLPPVGNMMGQDRQGFVRRGTALFQTIEKAIKDYKPDHSIEKMQILDFGCGVGRIAMPFFYKYKRPTRCVDVVLKYIRYLQETIPDANPRMGRRAPPLEFYSDNFFDVIYSISVFTHLEPAQGDLWLREIHRLLKPGGLALISTSSHSQLKKHHLSSTRSPLWADVTEESFEREGIVFRGTYNRGMRGIYGCTIHTPEWVRENWSKVFDYKESRIRVLGANQDLNIMVKRQEHE
jgi:SAM-dependent methyltransferase